jgi:hypothetical protein
MQKRLKSALIFAGSFDSVVDFLHARGGVHAGDGIMAMKPGINSVPRGKTEQPASLGDSITSSTRRRFSVPTGGCRSYQGQVVIPFRACWQTTIRTNLYVQYHPIVAL